MCCEHAVKHPRKDGRLTEEGKEGEENENKAFLQEEALRSLPRVRVDFPHPLSTGYLRGTRRGRLSRMGRLEGWTTRRAGTIPARQARLLSPYFFVFFFFLSKGFYGFL